MFEPHRRHCVVSLSKNINRSLVLVQPRKARPFITERLLMGRKESNQTSHFFGLDRHPTCINSIMTKSTLSTLIAIQTVNFATCFFMLRVDDND